MATSASTQQQQSWVESLPNLQGLVDAANYKKCSSTALKILQHEDVATPLPDDVRFVLSEIHVRSLLKSNSFQVAYDFCTTNVDNKDRFPLEEAYALYRLKRYDAGLKAANKALRRRPTNKDDNPGLVHVAAQCLYRLHRTTEAVELYGTLADSKTEHEEEEEAATNLLACLQSTYDSLSPPPAASVPDHEASQSSYDAAYNYGTYVTLAATGTSELRRGERTLRHALELCRSSLEQDGCDDEEIQRECAPIKANLAYTLLLVGQDREAEVLLEDVVGHDSGAPPSARTSAANNLAVRRVGSESLFDSLKRLPAHKNSDFHNANHPCTPHMMRSILYNKAVLLSRMGREADCKAVLAVLDRGNVLHAEEAAAAVDTGGTAKQKKKKKSNRHGKATTPEDHHCATQLRARLLEAELLRVKGDVRGADELLTAIVDDVPDDRVLLQAEAELVRTQSLLLRQDDDVTPALAQLEHLRNNDTLGNKPAVLATLMSLYRDSDDKKKASELLSGYELDGGDTMTLGEYYVQLGMYEEAVQVFEEILKRDESNDECLALLVVALSYLDAESAEERLSGLASGVDDLTHDEEEEEVLDGEDLESRDVPWTSSSTSRRFLKHNQARGGDKGKQSKNQASVLRARARKREAYLLKLQEAGKYNPDRPGKIDAERWVPKRQRSYFRGRRKNRNYGKGTTHQGISAGMEDARLDARARAAEGKVRHDDGVGSAPSTKHMSVSSGGGNFKKRGGRKR